MGKTGDRAVRALFIAALLALSVAVLEPASSEKNPPVPGSGGMYETPGHWTIESGDDVIWENALILVNGDLVVERGGRLVLNTVELRFNCTVDGLFRLVVEDGGTLQVIDSVITSQDQSNHYRMVLSGSVVFEGVAVSEVFGDPDNPWDHGIELRSSSIEILNSSFYRNMGDVLHVESSSPRIVGNYFYENAGAAIYTNGTSSPIISGNEVYRQRFGIVSGFYSSPVIDGNLVYDIDNNGILLNGYMYPRVSNNTVRDCLNGMLMWYSNAILENNLVYNNEAGYNIKVESSPTIKGDVVRNNLYVGISINDSMVEIIDSEIYSNKYDGIRVFNGSRLRVLSCDIERNDDDGFQVTDAYLEVTDSLVDGNQGDQFFLRDSAVMDLIDSTVRGSWGGPAGMERWHFNIGEGSTVSTFDSEFEKIAVGFGDTASRLTVSYTCSFFVTDGSSYPVPDVTINILNETGYRRAVGTGVDGRGERYLSFYNQRDSNGDGDGEDPGEKDLHDYNFTISHTGFLPYEDSIDIEGGDHKDVVLTERPYVKVLGTTPDNGDMDVDVETGITVRFDKEVDPSTLDMVISKPGGAPLFFDVYYDREGMSIEAIPMNELEHSTTYTVEIRGVTGVSGERLNSIYYLSFRTVDPPDPDNDEDGIPDRQDPDDDNDGFDDVVEEYYGTNPFDPLEYPLISSDDDDADPVDDPEPSPDDDDGDDDDDPGIVIIPGTVVDDDDNTGTDDDLDPVSTNETMPDDPDGNMDFIILVIGTIFGLIILLGVILLIFARGRGGHRLREIEYRPPPGG
ncbi:MAG: right-handed parallel beta-helix repeat-containing protein [Thermoplasmatota archaeon]